MKIYSSDKVRFIFILLVVGYIIFGFVNPKLATSITTEVFMAVLGKVVAVIASIISKPLF